MPAGRWTQQEVEDLVYQIVSENRALPQLHIPGKSQAAINNRRRRLKITGRLGHVFVGRKLKPWTIRELKHLRSLTIDYGFSAEFIAQLQLIPGRSKHAVGKMMGRVGLGNPAVKERSRQAHRLGPSRRLELDQYLIGDGRLTPAAEVSRQWGLAQKTVNSYRRRLGIPLTWQQARSSEECRRKQQACARQFVERTVARWREWFGRKTQSLRSLKEKMEQSPSAPPHRACRNCGENWFASPEFFYAQTRTVGLRRKTTMSRTCRLCRSVRQRSQAFSPCG
jgi:hypothetical protein